MGSEFGDLWIALQMAGHSEFVSKRAGYASHWEGYEPYVETDSTSLRQRVATFLVSLASKLDPQSVSYTPATAGARG